MRRKAPPSSATNEKKARTVPVVVGRGERLATVVDDEVARGVEEGEVEVELAGEVLVEHRLRDARLVGDVLHRGLVVALGDEDAESRLEQLGAALGPRHPLDAGAGRGGAHGLSFEESAVVVVWITRSYPRVHVGPHEARSW